MDVLPKRRRGCLFYGGIVAVVILLLSLAGLLAGWHAAKKLINSLTDPAPMPLPSVEMPAEQLEQLQRRVNDFKQAVREGSPTSPLELSADEINALIASDPTLRDWKGKIFVSIENDHPKALMSFPTDDLHLPLLKGRYLNGSATLNLSLENGTLRLAPLSVIVKGKPLPEVYMKNLRRQNLAQSLNSDPRTSSGLAKLQDISVKDGKLVIVPKASAGTPK
jgi:hypothetical protein